VIEVVDVDEGSCEYRRTSMEWDKSFMPLVYTFTNYHRNFHLSSILNCDGNCGGNCYENLRETFIKALITIAVNVDGN